MKIFRVICDALFGRWVVEDCVININPNSSMEINFGYRNSLTGETRIQWYPLGDFHVLLRADGFLGFDKIVGIRIDNLGTLGP